MPLNLTVHAGEHVDCRCSCGNNIRVKNIDDQDFYAELSFAAPLSVQITRSDAKSKVVKNRAPKPLNGEGAD